MKNVNTIVKGGLFEKNSIVLIELIRVIKEALEKKHMIVDNININYSVTHIQFDINIFLLRRFIFLFNRNLIVSKRRRRFLRRSKYYGLFSELLKKAGRKFRIKKNSLKLRALSSKQLKLRKFLAVKKNTSVKKNRQSVFLRRKYPLKNKRFLITEYLYDVLKNSIYNVPNNIILNISILNTQHRRNIKKVWYREGLKKLSNRILFGYKRLFSLRSKDLGKDLALVSALFANGNLRVDGFLNLICRVFKPLHKKSHNIFYSLIEDLFNLIIQLDIDTQVVGLEIKFSGRLQGRTQAKSKKISAGLKTKQYECSYLTVHNKMGAFGFRMNVYYVDEDNTNENVAYLIGKKVQLESKKHKVYI